MNLNKPQILSSLKKSCEAAISAYNGPESDWPKQYAPGKWTVRQILVHLADVEMVHLWRYSRALAEPGSIVFAFDHDRWVSALRYDERPIEVCKNMFLGLRGQILYYVEQMPELTFSNMINHSENGPVTVSAILNYLCYHTDHHLEQIQFAREGRLWTPKQT
ncbi:MAG: DinB family protein [Candidatus Hydrogenedentes bacterium]|nr:DinB family protein [Candidatus Hydrogenedentota bacterium]